MTPACPRCAQLEVACSEARETAAYVRRQLDEARETASTLALLLEAVADRLTPEEAAEVAQTVARAVR